MRIFGLLLIILSLCFATVSFAQVTVEVPAGTNVTVVTYTPYPSATATQTLTSTAIATPTATSTATATPTSTPVPTATQTPAPVATATAVLPTATPVPEQFIDGVHVCDGLSGRPTHDPTLWHAAVEKNPDGSILCAYGHEHNDDPSQLDTTFGPMGAWWNNGEEYDISYPWETLRENEDKHTAYKVVVRGTDTSPLRPWFTTGGGGKTYIRAFRATYHLDGAKAFANPKSQIHSFSWEMQVCSLDNNCGIARWGGVQDLGERLLTHDDNSFTCVYVNTALRPDQGICPSIGGPGMRGFPGPGAEVGPRTMAGGPDDSRVDETWYGSQNQLHNKGGPVVNLDFGTVGGVWSPVHILSPLDAASPDPAVRGDYPPHFSRPPTNNPFNVDRWNHGTAITVSALNAGYSGFPAVNGRINFSGSVDRYGNLVTGCTSEGPDCVPLRLENVPATGFVGFRDPDYVDQYGVFPSGTLGDYEALNPKTGRSLIVWPN